MSKTANFIQARLFFFGGGLEINQIAVRIKIGYLIEVVNSVQSMQYFFSRGGRVLVRSIC